VRFQLRMKGYYDMSKLIYRIIVRWCYEVDEICIAGLSIPIRGIVFSSALRNAIPAYSVPVTKSILSRFRVFSRMDRSRMLR